MLPFGPVNRLVYIEEVFDQCDISKGNSGLHHAEWAGVHAQQYHGLGALAVAMEVGFVRFSGINQGIVHVDDRRCESERVRLFCECSAYLYQRLHAGILRVPNGM